MNIQSISFGFHHWAATPPKLQELEALLKNKGAIAVDKGGTSYVWRGFSSKVEAEFTNLSMKLSSVQDWLQAEEFEGWSVTCGLKFKLEVQGIIKTYTFMSCSTPSSPKLVYWVDNQYNRYIYLNKRFRSDLSQMPDKNVTGLIEQYKEGLAEIIQIDMGKYASLAKAKFEKIEKKSALAQEVLLGKPAETQAKGQSIWD